MPDERYTGWLCHAAPTAPKGIEIWDHQRAVASPYSVLARIISEAPIGP
jgi:hypothetical protein